MEKNTSHLSGQDYLLRDKGKPKSHLSDLWPRFRFGEDYKI